MRPQRKAEWQGPHLYVVKTDPGARLDINEISPPRTRDIVAKVAVDLALGVAVLAGCALAALWAAWRGF